MLEDSLRETFAERTHAAPVLDDPATEVIHRGRRARHRRMVAGTLVAVLAAAGVLGGTLSLRSVWHGPVTGTGVLSPVLPPDEPEPEPSPEPTADRALEVDLRMVNRIWPPDGAPVLLSGSALVEQAYRTPYGLVYGNQLEILLRGDDDAVVELATGVGEWVLAPDGRQVAFSSGRDVVRAPLESGRLGDRSRAPVPQGTVPVMFWGERVVLSGPDGFGLWHPAGQRQPVWTHRVAAVYGPAGDDLVVLAGRPDDYCLTVIKAGSETMGELDAGCAQPLPVSATEPGWLAPDGAWLAVPSGETVLLLEVEALLAGGEAAALAGEQAGGPEPTACPRRETVTPAWQDASTLLSADQHGAVSCDVRGTIERRALPEQVGSRWEYVPSLGAGG